MDGCEYFAPYIKECAPDAKTVCDGVYSPENIVIVIRDSHISKKMNPVLPTL